MLFSLSSMSHYKFNSFSMSMPQPPSAKIFTVGEITEKIKTFLEKNYRFIRITGEISNLKTSFAGHSYFTLKDSSAQLQAVLFKQQKRFVDTALDDGQKVICFGRITVYEPRGSYQLVVDSVEPAGAGKIRLEFERVKAQLAAQGYFDEERKQPIPQFAEKVAVISSPNGAAFADFLKIIRLRRANMHIQLYPVAVQGENAPVEIAAAIKALDSLHRHDVLVLIRGGGSLEDLQAFNDKRVAEAIFSAKLPIMTGIGHQIDFTIADFCADHRCPTPTAAAEYLASDSSALQRQLHTLRSRLISRIRHQLESEEQRLRFHRRSLAEIPRQFAAAEHQITLCHTRINAAVCGQISIMQNRIKDQSYRLQLNAPDKKITAGENSLFSLQQRLQQRMMQSLDNNRNKLEKMAALLHSVSPLATLARGYAVARKKVGRQNFQVITRAETTSSGEQIEVLLHQGKLECLIEKTFPAEENITSGYTNNSRAEKK